MTRKLANELRKHKALIRAKRMILLYGTSLEVATGRGGNDREASRGLTERFTKVAKHKTWFSDQSDEITRHVWWLEIEKRSVKNQKVTLEEEEEYAEQHTFGTMR